MANHKTTFEALRELGQAGEKLRQAFFNAIGAAKKMDKLLETIERMTRKDKYKRK